LAEKEKAQTKSNVLSMDLSSSLRAIAKGVGEKLEQWLGGSVVTLDIDSKSIRLLEMKGKVVEKWAEASFETSIPEGEQASGLPALSKALRQLMDSSGIKAKKVIASLSGLYTLSRILPDSALPPAPTTGEAILEIANEIMPLPETRRYLSWQAISNKEGERLFLAVAVAREMLDSQVQALKAAGIDPYVVELRSMALVRAVDKKQAIILNIDSPSIDIIVIVDNVPEVIRTIAWNPSQLSIEETAEYLATTLESIVEFYNSHHLETPLDPATLLFVTGQLSMNSNLIERLNATSSFHVAPLELSVKYPAYLPISQYAVNIGLALRKSVTSKNKNQDGVIPLDLNLLPGAYRPWRPKSRHIYAAIILIAGFTLLFPLFQIAGEAMSRTVILEAKFKTLNSQLELKKREIQKRDPLQKAVAEYQNIVGQRVGFEKDIEVILGEAGKLGVTVSTVRHRGNSIEVSCKAEDYLTFRKYLQAIEESGRFLSPIPPPEGYPYTASGTIILKPQIAEGG